MVFNLKNILKQSCHVHSLWNIMRNII